MKKFWDESCNMGEKMGKGMKRYLSLGLILMGLLSGCHSPGESTKNTTGSVALVQETEGASSQITDTLSYYYDSFRMESTVTFPQDSSVTKDSTIYIASFPHFENKTVQAFVLRSQVASDTLTLQKAAETFINEYERFQESFPFPRSWNSETSTKVLQITNSYIGLQTDHYNYTGGAHGIYNTHYTHFWVPDQIELSFPELVDTSRLGGLLTIAEQHFWAQEEEKDQELSMDLYFFDNNQFFLPENIAFEQDSLLFLYNIYEIKPYVYGQTELRLPYAEILPFLTEKARHIIKIIKEK